MTDVLPCAIYTRKSSEEGLEQGFNSLDAQREACEAFILSQKTQGWKALPTSYDDGGFAGGSIVRPALQRLLVDIAARRVRIVVVYKVDRLTRSLADFAKLVELFDAHGVSFVSVTQQFNTTSSMGRLTLNVLLSFAQFEREVTGERIRDKIAASKRKGMWMGGIPPIGYLAHERTLVIDAPQAERIREIFRLYLELGCVRRLKAELDRRGWVTPPRTMRRANAGGGRPFSRGHLYRLLGNPIYLGQIAHKGAVFPGLHPAIIDTQAAQAVREMLVTNLQGHRTRSNTEEPSLLAGLVADDQGCLLTPTHAKKGVRRYRYYVSPPHQLTASDAAPRSLRWPAPEFEDAVLGVLIRFLTDESRLLGVMGTVGAAEVSSRLQRAARMAEKLSRSPSGDKIGVLQRIVSRITVRADRLDIAVRTGAVWSSSETDSNAATTVVAVPVQLKRCGMAVRLIVQSPLKPNRAPDAKLVALVAKAHDWLIRLTSGRCDSVQAIAQEEKVTSSYVTRVAYLGCMAPDIVERIATGQHPVDLTAKRLIRMVPLPLEWDEQRRLLGIAG